MLFSPCIMTLFSPEETAWTEIALQTNSYVKSPIQVPCFAERVRMFSFKSQAGMQ